MRLSILYAAVFLASVALGQQKGSQQPADQTAAALIETAIANAAVNAKAAYGFTFHEEYQNAVQTGTRPTSSSSRQYDVLFVEGVPYRRLAGVNGKPLSGVTAAEESRRYDQAVAAIHALTPEQRQHVTHPSQVYAALLMDPKLILGLYDCDITGHEHIERRTATVVRCKLRHDALQDNPPNTAGPVPLGREVTLWIDDEKPFMRRVRTRFDRPFESYAEATVTTTWNLIEGVWLQTATKISWVNAANRNVSGTDTDTFSKFKRFRTSAILLPAGSALDVPVPSPIPHTAPSPEISTETPLSPASSLQNTPSELPPAPPQNVPPSVAALRIAPVPAASPAAIPPPAAIQAPETVETILQTAPPDPSMTTLKTTTRLTVVDVTVTDAKGKPVHGLTESDFRLKEDSKPQPLKNFQEYGTEKPLTSTPPPALPPDTYTNQQATPPTSGALNIILIDDVTTGLKIIGSHPEFVMYAKQQAQKYLNTMPTGTQVAIAELTDKVRIVQGFTTDRTILLKAINSIAYKDMPDSHTTYHPVLVEFLNAVNTQNRRALGMMNQISAFLAGIKGRKNLIWFTPGVPVLTNYAYFSRGYFTDFTPELKKAYSLLNSSEVAIYPMDPQGLTGISDLGEISSISPTLSFVNRSLQHESMQDFAEATGGKPYFNRNDLDTAIGEAISTGSDYYSLSYVPPIPKYDGKYHTIDVKLDRPGLHLQYRKGYNSIDTSRLIASPGKPADPSTPPAIAEFHKAMANGEPPSTQVLFTVRVAPSPPPNNPPVKGSLNPTVKAKSLIRYNILYAVSGSQLTFLEDPSGARKTSIEFDIAAYDGEGKLLNILRQTGNLTIKPENVVQIAQRTFQVPLQLDLPPGKLSVRIGVLDVPSNKIGTLQVPVTVSQN